MMASVANINELGGYTLNPRGNLWFNDESTFGQKMLMKMGWSKGKGLGKNEDGIKENLKVKFKCTNGGLGYKDQSYDNVMKGEYESILKNLSAQYSRNNIHKSDSENENAKQKSRIVKRKIRYPKLFYGKDVSKYSEKDMKSIFLSSLPSHEMNEDEEVKPNNHVSSCLADSKKELPKLLDSYNSQLSVSDYFTLKMEQKKGKKLKKEVSDEINQDSSNILSNETENRVGTSKKKSQKRKKELTNSNSDVSNLEEIETERENSSYKKKRKLSEGLHSERFSKVDNLETSNTNDNSQSISPIKKRKKYHKLDVISSTNSNMLSSDSEVHLNASSPPSKKRKKLHNGKNSEFEENIQLLSVDTLKQENNKSPKSCLNVEGGYKSLSDMNTKKSVKLKNKLKALKSCFKNKKNKLALKNVSFNENVSYKIIDSSFETENKTIPCIDIDECDSPTEEISNNYELNKDSNDETSVQNTSLSIENGNDACTEIEQAACVDETECNGNEQSETDLPSSNLSHYNSWIESQKQALKMKMYKSMLKNIKKHAILRTANMLSIKGYGNWGI